MPHKIGIDFGTSFSTMSFIDPDTGKPAVLKNEYGEDKTPSVVYFGEHETLVGKAAVLLLQQSVNMPPEERDDILQRTFRSIKRKLRHDVLETLPDGRTLRHAEIVAEILKHLKEVAEGYHWFVGGRITDVALTCPVLFTKKQREILKEAAELAGFENVETQEEPIAAALGYAGSESIGDNILIYDLGGGTFDLAFVHRDADGKLTTPIDPMGDNACAGDDFDLAIYHHWERQLLADADFGHGFTQRPGSVDPTIQQHARDCKEHLSQAQTSRTTLYFPASNRNRTFTLSREEFHHLAEPLVTRTLSLVERMLDKIADLGLTPDIFLLIGGSCRMPIILNRLSQLHTDGTLPIQPLRVMQADVAVALGAVVETKPIQPPPPPPPPEKKAGDRIVLDIKGMQYPFRWCPPGTFMMGSPASEEERSSDETQHQVTLTCGFWMLETPVTQEMWKYVMKTIPVSAPQKMPLTTPDNGNPFSLLSLARTVVAKGVTKTMLDTFVGDKLPVQIGYWEDCQRFIQDFNSLSVAPAGYRFLLPTEAQWEYACRAGTTTPFHFGSSLSGHMANCNGYFCYPDHPEGFPRLTRPQNLRKPTEVGSYPPNAWGLYDMHGNIRECCSDWLGEYPHGDVTDPVGASSGSLHALRGGSWKDMAKNCRSASREKYETSSGLAYFGLRLVLVRAE